MHPTRHTSFLCQTAILDDLDFSFGFFFVSKGVNKEYYKLLTESWKPCATKVWNVKKDVTKGQVLKGRLYIRPRPNIISRPKVFLVKESTRIKIILIASYFLSEIELATIDIHFSYRTI